MKLSPEEKLAVMVQDIPRKEYMELLHDYNALAEREVVLVMKIHELQSVNKRLREKQCKK